MTYDPWLLEMQRRQQDPNAQHFAQVPVIGNPEMAPPGYGQQIVDPMPVGMTDVRPRGAFSPDVGSPNPVGGLAAHRAAPPGPGQNYGARLMGGLRSGAETVGRGLRAGAGMAARGFDAYGAGQPDARMGYASDRQAAFQRIGDIGQAMMIAGAPRREPGSTIGRLGESLRDADAMGRTRRGENRQERQVAQGDRGLDIAEGRTAATLEAARIRAQATGSLKPSDQNSLRGQFLQQSKPFQNAKSGWNSIQAAWEGGGTQMSDNSMIFAYAKILDPEGSVRDGDRKSILSSASLPERFIATAKSIFAGGSLTPTQRQDMYDNAARNFAGRVAMQETLEGQYSGLASEYQLDPERIVVSQLGGLEGFSAPDPASNPRGAIPGVVSDAAGALGSAVERGLDSAVSPKAGDTIRGEDGRMYEWRDE